MCFHMDYICPFVSFRFPFSRKFVFYCKLNFSKLQEVYFSSLLICSRHIATTPMITPTTIPAPKAAHAIQSSPLRFSEYSRLLMILCRQTIKNVPCFSHGEYSRISPESSQMHMLYQISEYQRKEKELQRCISVSYYDIRNVRSRSLQRCLVKDSELHRLPE